jgi:hypothetical protein
MTLALGTIAMLSVTSFAALAQTAPPTYQADPGVYKVIFEDQNFRVMEGTWKKGERDKAHSHPVPSVGYALTDCVIRIHQPDGKTRDITNKAGTALTIPMTGSRMPGAVGRAQIIAARRQTQTRRSSQSERRRGVRSGLRLPRIGKAAQ